ncbi:MAG: lysogenic conversion protein [Methylomarinum sp.]|nr:lysogenic conversion protein [Methylomarinum sp.]
MARDNFTKIVIEKLKARVAHRCSNPDCRVPTSAPSADNKVNNIGVAAHIHAASSGGPRYDKLMTVAERKSIDNAIWLCANCSINIDRDENRYTDIFLKEWKVKAEDTARAELGKKLPSNNETIDTVTAALTGLPKNPIMNAISNVHQATEKAYEFIDPRFLVKTAHNDGLTSIRIYAKEDVSLMLNVRAENVSEYLEKYRYLIEHGKDFVMKSEAITIEGSKLFDEIFNHNDGTLSILTKKKQATQKLWLVKKETGVVEVFDDILGTITFGTKSFAFNGSAYNKIFSLSFRKNLVGSHNEANFTMHFCFDQWEGMNLMSLPYFDKVLSLISKLAQGWEIYTSLEIMGVQIFSSQGMQLNELDYILCTNTLLHYTKRCKIISIALRQDIDFTSDVSFTADEHQNIVEIVEIIEGEQVYDESKVSNLTCNLLVDDECKNVKMLVESTEPTSMQWVEKVADKVSLFGNDVTLPAKIISLDPVIPKIRGKVDELKSGDAIKIEWVPQKGFKCTVSYEL